MSLVALGIVLAPSSSVAAVPHQHVIARYEYVPSGTLSKELTGASHRVASYPLSRGDTLAFINLDQQPHTVTSCDPCDPYPIVSAAFDSGFLTMRESWTLRTEGLEPGTYGYFCLHHPFLMRGSFTLVEDS